MDVRFAVAAARLASLAGDGSLATASQVAWQEGMARVRPAGPAQELPRLVRACFLGPRRRGVVISVMLRWEAAGVGGSPYPALDADITLIPDGDQATLLGLDGVYRPAGGFASPGPGAAAVHQAAAATVRSFLGEVARGLAIPLPASPGDPPVSGAQARAA